MVGRASVAGWSARELGAALKEARLGDLRGGAERLIGHFQAWFARGSGRTSGHATRWSAPPVPAETERLVRLLRGGLPALPTA